MRLVKGLSSYNHSMLLQLVNRIQNCMKLGINVTAKFGHIN